MEKLLELVQDKILPKWFIISTLVWIAAYLICFILGGIALKKYGEKQGINKKLLPWLLGVQIYCEALFAGLHGTARRIQHGLWWWWVTAAGCIACGIWLIGGYMGVEGVPLTALKVLLIVLVTVLVFLYVLIRSEELSALKRIFQKPLWWGLSVAGSIFCLPVQRIFLLFVKEKEL